MDILKLAVPAITGLLGAVKLLDKRSPAMRVITTILIIIGGAGSAVLVRESGRIEEQRAIAAEQAQKRAEEKLDRMSDALLDIQHDLAELQIELARGAQGQSTTAGAALKATIQKVDDAKQIARSASPPAGTQSTPVQPPATEPTDGPAIDGN